MVSVIARRVTSRPVRWDGMGSDRTGSNKTRTVGYLFMTNNPTYLEPPCPSIRPVGNPPGSPADFLMYDEGS